jgi:hypothetical protein
MEMEWETVWYIQRQRSGFVGLVVSKYRDGGWEGNFGNAHGLNEHSYGRWSNGEIYACFRLEYEA